MNYQLEDVKNMRGFDALTQSERRLETKLVDNANAFNGKVRGFNKTRKEVLTEEFDRIALQELVEISVDTFNNDLVGKNKVIMHVVKKLCERIVRDFVPMDMAQTFSLSIAKAIRLHNDDKEEVMNIIENYFTCGVTVPVAETYREVLQSLEEGRILYYEPRKRIDSQK